MSDHPPIVDQDLLDSTRSHIRTALQLGEGAAVPGDGLVQGFARLAGIVADRINGAADKNFLAFLDLVGVRQTPPQAARVPLTFTLARGAPNDAFVAAGSTAAAPPGAGATDPIVFETERDLVVTRAQLLAAIVLDPARDRLSDLVAALAASGGQGADPFAGTVPLSHRLLIGSDGALALGNSQQVQLSFSESAGAPDWLGGVDWDWWDGSAWQSLGSGSIGDPGQITFTGVPEIPVTTIAGVADRWIGATLASPLPATNTIRDQTSGALKVSGQGPADAAYADSEALDLGQPFAPFGATGSAGAFLVRADAAFGKPDAAVELRLDLDPTHAPVAPSGFGLTWEYWTGTEWAGLSVTATPDTPGLDPSALLGSGTISFTAPADWAPTTWPANEGDSGYWLMVTRPPSLMYSTVPIIDALSVSLEWEAPRLSAVSVSSYVGVDAAYGPLPDVVLVNGAPVDATRDFRALGPTPAAGAALYLACDEAIDPTRNQVVVKVALTTGVTPFSPAPTLAWEYWDAKALGWQALTVADKTSALTSPGTVMFTPPPTLGAVSVAGRTHRWVRARLAAGDYGHPATYVSDGKGGYAFSPATLAPPSIASVRFGYSARIADPQPSLLVLEDWSPASGTQQISAGPPALGADGAFDPYTPMPIAEPTLMLAFSEPFANAGIDLYFSVAPTAAGGASAQAGGAPLLAWEYSDGTSWRALGARDETSALSASGLVSFVGPEELVVTEQLGASGAWLRGRLIAGGDATRSALLALRTGTMWASQLHAVSQEPLGSGTAQPNQELQTTQSPVLEGQRVEVLEPEAPPAGELAALGPGSVRPALDAAGQSTGVWVTWIEVTDFVASGPRDRHYVVDRVLGTVTFGDGRRGLVPPAGRGNMEITYSAGGGQGGNLSAGTITQLRTAIPFISGVINHEPSEGGADAEDISVVSARGPRTLRHRGRSIASADYEDLAFEASTAVARSLAVPAAGPSAAGQVGLVIVPSLGGPRPTPSGELLAQVRDYIVARMTPTAELWISGPGWLEVTVSTGLVPVEAELTSDVQAAALTALTTFLDPLTGGTARLGWPFGREPFAADLIAVLEQVDGLDHVAWLAVDKIVLEPPPGPQAYLVSSGEHTITMLTPGATT